MEEAGAARPGLPTLYFCLCQHRKLVLNWLLKALLFAFTSQVNAKARASRALCRAADKHRLTTPQRRANGPPGDPALGTLSTRPGSR